MVLKVDWETGFWQMWFGIHAGREAGNPYRTFLEDANKLSMYVKEREVKREPCYISVQPYQARDRVYGLEKLFFDFDSIDEKLNLSKAWRDARHFAEALKRFYCLKPLILFSGRRGYHVYVWLWRVVEFQPEHDELAKTVYQTLQDILLRGLNYETLDPEVLGDIKRLARMPYTLHEKTGLLCEPVTDEGALLKSPILDLEDYLKRGVQETLFCKVIEKVKLKGKIDGARRKRLSPINPAKGSRVRPCIKEALQVSLDGEYGHLMRLAIAAEYLNNGYTVDQVASLFKNQGDFDVKKTRAMVEHAKKRGYRPVRRETLRRYGFCHGNSCGACIKVHSKEKRRVR